ncbi:hypothetical protein ACEPAI_2987 [Sanghuangporus weigelae]
MPDLPDEYVGVAYLRIASMAIGLYELICTLPAEYRFYRQQILRRSFSQQCLLFILIRYVSIVVVVLSNVGFFGRFPSIESCRRFMLISPIFKALQTFVSQLILASRTYSISRKSRWVFWTMMVTLGLTVPMEFYSNIHGRTPQVRLSIRIVKPIEWILILLVGSCTSGNSNSLRIAWVHYLDAVIFDLVAICISTGYLWSYSSTATRISHFVHRLLYEGLGYFVILTAVNVFNLVLYLREDENNQSSGASLGYVLIFIMSQRILIRQRDYADKYNAATSLPSTSHQVSVSRRLDTTREINEALRSQFDHDSSQGGILDSFGSKQSVPGPPSWYQAPLSPTSECSQSSHLPRTEMKSGDVGLDSRRQQGAEHSGTAVRYEAESGLDVEVRVERTVSVQRIPTAVALGRENYRKPRVTWEQWPVPER